MYRPITPLLPGPTDKKWPIRHQLDVETRNWMCFQLCPIACDTHWELLPTAADFMGLAVRCDKPLRPNVSRLAVGCASNWVRLTATRRWMCFQLRPIDCDTQLGLLPTASDFVAARSEV